MNGSSDDSTCPSSTCEPGHLLLWGGFGLVLWLTVGILGAGGLLFLVRDKVERWQARVPALLERIRQLHPYDVPEFLVLPVEQGSEAYLHWIAAATSPEPA